MTYVFTNVIGKRGFFRLFVQSTTIKHQRISYIIFTKRSSLLGVSTFGKVGCITVSLGFGEIRALQSQKRVKLSENSIKNQILMRYMEMQPMFLYKTVISNFITSF